MIEADLSASRESDGRGSFCAVESTLVTASTQTILIVDDNASAVAALEALLAPLGHRILVARDGEQALATAQAERPDMMLLDVMMPGLNGFQVCQAIRAHPDTRDLPVVLITALQDQDSRIEGLRAGADDFLSKPVDRLELRTRVKATLRADRYRRQLAQHQVQTTMLEGCVSIMRDILSMVDPPVFGQTRRMERVVRQLGEAIDYAPLWELEVAALLCQVGRVTLPEDVRTLSSQPHKLGPRDAKLVRHIPDVGAQLLDHVPGFERVSEIVAWQDKRFDGTGHPSEAVSGSDIPLGARILRLVRDLLTLEDGGLGRRAALEVCRGRPGHYDPELIEVALDIFVSDESMDQLVNLRELTPGMMTRSSICDTSGRVMVAPGQELTPTMIARLKNFQERLGLVEPFEVRLPTPRPEARPATREAR
jgi:response regulator RpfG family c-di-GMP phosphodiesterase